MPSKGVVDLPKVEEELDTVQNKSFIELNKTDEGLKKIHEGNTKKLSRNPFSYLTFNAAASLVKKGFSKVLLHEEVFDLPAKYHTDALYKKFEPAWLEEQKKEKPSLVRAVRGLFGVQWAIVLVLQILYGVSSFVIPIVLPYLLRFILFRSIEEWRGYMYISVILGVSLFGSLIYYQAYYLSNMIGVQLRSILTEAVYRKVLSFKQTKQTNSGQIVNLIANDAQFFSDTIVVFNSGLTAPFQIIIGTGVLWWHIGAYSLLAPGVLLLIMPVTVIVGRRLGFRRFAVQAQADKRLKLMNELINGIRIVKFYAWEAALKKNINAARDQELKMVKHLGYERSILILVMTNTTVFATIAIFVFYGLFGPKAFTPDIAFAVLSVMTLLRSPFFVLPLGLSFVQQYKVTFDRIATFLLLPDLNEKKVKKTKPEKQIIKIKNGSFSWTDGAAQLQDVNIKVKRGNLHMAVGPVGSGKSTLISAVLGEVAQVQGKRKLKGSIAYIPQEAWIINATVKENILFGEPYDERKYEQVLEAAALRPDLIQLPNGDATEIGERGITLSGGQKQRVSIARALYANRDIYLMDDPFSAVDAHVGKHLFEVAVQQYLKDKTILLVTNQLQYLAFADKIYVFDEGKQVGSGKLNELKDSNETMKELLQNFGTLEEEEEEEEQEKKEEKKQKKELKPSATQAVLKKEGNGAKLEEKQQGLVSLAVYWYYAKQGGLATLLVIMIAYAIGTTLTIMSSWWLAQWTTYPSYPTPGKWGAKDSDYWVWTYSLWLLGQPLTTIISVLAVIFFSLVASRKLHQNMLDKVVRAPTSFFDVTPVGRIINRFAKELTLIDFMLPINISQYLNAVFSLIGTFAAMIIGSYWMALVIVPAMIFYFWFQTFYRKTSIELQRLEAVSRAPIISHLAETINGATSIRAYGMAGTFKNMNSSKLEYNTIEFHAQKYCASWFGLVLDAAGQFLVFITLLAIVLSRNYSYDSLDVGLAGIAMTYMAGMTFTLSQLNNGMVELETRMNSVERVKEYNDLPQEADDIIEGKRPPKEWPTKGVVEFKDYSLAYKKGENVLDSITLTVEDKEKIGIVGRTGAGKSSLLLALFRMIEPAAGSIIIDGIDIAKIGLRDLRSKLAIIPQDPVLFVGTLRYNLDPFGEYSDKELWNVLEMVRLKEVVSQLEGKLDEVVQEKGSNFSVGQRQLICMARALLRNSKILLMDEATASVDINTDAVIQRMVRKNFNDVTVLTIAHRLNTIMDSSKVMVLDKGKLAEYDKPVTLLEDPKGHFTSMVDSAGPNVSAYLRQMAKGEISIVEALEQEREKEKLKESLKLSGKRSQKKEVK